MAHSSLPGHAKLARLCRRLKISRPLAIGHLELLWLYVGDHHYDGVLSSMTVADIEWAAEWRRGGGAFVEACVAEGFLDRGEDGVIAVHDWLDWRQDYVTKRDQRRNGKGLSSETAAARLPRGVHAAAARRPELNRIEPKELIPPLPPAGERPVVEPKKPSSKSGRATWEQAWSAFCDGAALDARGAADYEYPTREWFEHKKSKGPLSERGWRALGRQVKTWGADRLRQAVDYSSSNGYQGLFEAKTNGKPVYQTEAPEMPTLTQLKERGLL